MLPLRRRAIATAEQWMLERFEQSDGLGAIYPPIVWSIVALKCLGYADDSPEVRYCHKQLDDLCSTTKRPARSACSPASRRSGTRRSPCGRWRPAAFGPTTRPMRRAVDWLLERQIRRPGDWSETVAAEPGGWCFEYANDFYPDVDDTAMVADGPAPAVRRWRTRLPRSAAAGVASGRSGDGRSRCRPVAERVPTGEADRDRPADRRPSSAGSTGCWPCRTTTAAGARSTATTTASSSATCRSPITTR